LRTNQSVGELLVKIEAAALNPMYVRVILWTSCDLRATSGYKLMQMLPNALAKRPHTAESDFTGIVVASQGVTGFDTGEAVCGWISQREFAV
jgi:NADPH:quinone reductase-like Zn-dependent oxidoreductase